MGTPRQALKDPDPREDPESRCANLGLTKGYFTGPPPPPPPPAPP